MLKVYHFLCIVPILGQYSINTVYPPHGCYNYGLCAEPTPVTGSDGTLQFGCVSTNCICNEGTSGSRCVTVDNKCIGNPCSVLGPNYQCTSEISNYTCTCMAGWGGENCTIESDSVCFDNPCLNGGTCLSDDKVTYTCECGDYLGEKCQYENPCDSSPCENGGTCEILWDGADYYCDCAEGYQGKKCEDRDVTWDSLTNQGCYYYDSVLEDSSNYELYTDSKMTISKCNAFMKSFISPIYTMFTLVQTKCYVSTANYMNNTNAYGPNDGYCKTECPGWSKSKCGKSNKRAIWYTSTAVPDPHNCSSLGSSACTSSSVGKCIDLMDSDGGYVCSCKPPYEGADCSEIGDPCDPTPCNSGTCTGDASTMTYVCDCPVGYKGDQCQYSLQCATNPCLYGGTCIENDDNSYSCECLEHYYGDNCENADPCEYVNPCVNGSCTWLNTGINTQYNCSCDPGYEGKNCDIETNECAPEPCQYNSTCVDLFLDFECNCILGTTGKECEHNIDDCVEYVDENGVTHDNRCVTRDSNAVCVDQMNGFSCNCSEGWTDEFCDMKTIIKEVLTIVFGADGADNELLIPLLEDLLNNPAQIKDMVPFIIGTLTSDERKNLSWTADDLFQWVAFEEKRLDVDTDLTLWNDVVLGNCFTFNHRLASTFYKMRTSGREGGFRTLMNVQSGEFQPWFDTAAIMVFVHNKDEYIFSESVRYNAEPNGEMEIFVSDTRFTRLEGKYGVCVTDPSEVKAYYYEGMYTTDGCLRSCYQDMIQEKCNCMDPRYPYPEGKTSCQVIDMTCVETATEEEGDPSTWDSCVCPLPCENQQYSVKWSRAQYMNSPVECKSSTGVDKSCVSNHSDTVLISVILPTLNFQTYAEEPSMDLNRFISNLGGLLGVLMGVGIVWFIEVCFLLFHIISILVKG